MVLIGRTASMAQKQASAPKTGENSPKPTEAKRTPKEARGKASKNK